MPRQIRDLGEKSRSVLSHGPSATAVCLGRLDTKDKSTHVQLTFPRDAGKGNTGVNFNHFEKVSMASGDEIPAKNQKEQSKEEVRSRRLHLNLLG